MLARYTLLFGIAALSLASCKTSRSAFGSHAAPAVAMLDTDSTRVVLMHDSQSPEPTRVVVPASEAAAPAAPRVKSIHR
ncbi:hypothetical protein [Solirubrum puertoriconensis]|uniref:Lipoprotein n=1 Tax=Solirubrum puertoriconensis TaxID=1751427 RepID=A0A9X0HL31_SOLP1|nr:hypothetical protein [Solirubrum puertoriconensis]KUG07940.1 hypothetical protein ASU33_06940 [Solirubrum puertoriconensis]